MIDHSRTHNVDHCKAIYCHSSTGSCINDFSHWSCTSQLGADIYCEVKDIDATTHDRPFRSVQRQQDQ
ncbi:unnamed protein product [Calypogeia fissa]